MKDRYYTKNSKATHKSLKRWLLSLGYKEVCYGDAYGTNMVGYVYYQKPGKEIKVTYHWVKNPNGSGCISGKAISLEDTSSSYTEIMGKKTGYK